MENSNNFKIKPNLLFWEEVFSSFFKLGDLESNFGTLKKELINEDYPLIKVFTDYFEQTKKIKDCSKEFINIVISKNKQDLLANPLKLFDFLLEELHNELINLIHEIKEEKEKKEEEKKDDHITNSFRQEQDKAYEEFQIYEKNNKSFIQKLFFGIKKINKRCLSCGVESYKFDFLKFCPIDIQNSTGIFEIEDLYQNIQREFEKNYFCNNCKKKQNFNIRIEVILEPEIFIIFILNHSTKVKINFLEGFDDKYRIKTLVMGNEPIINKILCCKIKTKDFSSYGKDKEYFIFKKGNIINVKKDELEKRQPYIIFYQKKKEKVKNIGKEFRTEPNSKEVFLGKNKKNNNYEDELKNKINSSRENRKEIINFPSNDDKIKENKKKNKFSKSYNIYSNTNKNNDNNKNSNNYSNKNNDNFIKNNDVNNNNSQNIDIIKKKNKINNNINKNNDNLKNSTNIRNNINKNNINAKNSNNITNFNNKNLINKEKKINNLSLISNDDSINKSIEQNIKTSNISNLDNSDEEEELIRLYFKFNDGNIFFIDVGNSLTFEKILIELKAEYEWISIEDDNLYFKERKIGKNESPIKLGLNQGDYIYVNSNIAF